MRFILSWILVAGVLGGSVHAAGGDRLLPGNPTGFQFRKATLGIPLASDASINSANVIDEFTLSPLWGRLRLLVENRPALAKLRTQMEDPNLKTLIASKSGFAQFDLAAAPPAQSDKSVEDAKAAVVEAKAAAAAAKADADRAKVEADRAKTEADKPKDQKPSDPGA